MTKNIYMNDDLARNFVEASKRYEKATKLRISGVISQSIRKVYFDTPDELGLIR